LCMQAKKVIHAHQRLYIIKVGLPRSMEILHSEKLNCDFFMTSQPLLRAMVFEAVMLVARQGHAIFKVAFIVKIKE